LKGVLRRVEPVAMHERLSKGGTASSHLPDRESSGSL
jgi:hypothetical protein